MFSVVRRCPASFARNLKTVAISRQSLRACIPARPVPSGHFISHIPKSDVAALHQSARWQQYAAAEAEAGEDPADHGVITKFADLATRGLVHPNIISVITDRMRLETMTDVQTRTINEALSGVDIIAQAKTGTGKTLGFLIPVIQRMIENDPDLGGRVRGYKKARPDDIRAIVISPTRELAEQIAVEARKVTAGTGIIVQTAVGGTQKRAMLLKTQREGCHLLIGTPGRLKDILSDPSSRIEAPKLDALVMDEADRLLDDGFQAELDEIRQVLPDPQQVPRQTLMFSATIAREVVGLVTRMLKPGFHFAKCVAEDEVPTHERVPQHVVNVAGFENIIPTVFELVTREHAQRSREQGRPFKAIVYYNSTAEVTLAASVFFKLAGGFKRDRPLHTMRAFEIHAKLSQAHRTQAADDFRRCDSGILFSSDVTARGMDFPNVTHVIQVGLPRDRDTYVHRLGRTGRAGKEGEGYLILSPFERSEMRRRLSGLPIEPNSSLRTAEVDMTTPSEMPQDLNDLLQQVAEAHRKVYPDHLEAAYLGMFGSYQWYSDKHALLDGAERWAEFGLGMSQPPPPPSSLFRQGGMSRGGGRGSRYSDRDRSMGSSQSFGRPRGGYGDDRRSGDRGFEGGYSSYGGDDRRDPDRGFGGRGYGERDRRTEPRDYGREADGYGGRPRDYGRDANGYGGRARSGASRRDAVGSLF